MLHVPEDIQYFYREQLEGLEESKRQSYAKWIRYYLDFCANYRFTPYEQNSFRHFSQKLHDKGQSVESIEEAFQAVQLLLPYYELPPVEGVFSTNTEVVQSLISLLRQKNYSPRTVEAYTKWTRQFLTFHQGEVAAIDQSSVRKYLNYLAVTRKVSASAQNQAFNSLLFLFRHILKKEFGEQGGTIRAKRPGKKVPVVLSYGELNKLFTFIPQQYLFHFKLMYGCGLRLNELVELRLGDIDFELNTITISFSKQLKNRIVPMPQAIKSELQLFVDRALLQHKRNSEAPSYKGVFLPRGVGESEALSNRLLWLFPATKLVEGTRQYHLHHSVISKVLRSAVKQSGILKRITPHVLRHTYATHLLLHGYDIRTIQELLGHSSIETTMIYLHVLKDMEQKKVMSPLDLDWHEEK